MTTDITYYDMLEGDRWHDYLKMMMSKHPVTGSRVQIVKGEIGENGFRETKEGIVRHWKLTVHYQNY